MRPKSERITNVNITENSFSYRKVKWHNNNNSNNKNLTIRYIQRIEQINEWILNKWKKKKSKEIFTTAACNNIKGWRMSQSNNNRKNVQR